MFDNNSELVSLESTSQCVKLSDYIDLLPEDVTLRVFVRDVTNEHEKVYCGSPDSIIFDDDDRLSIVTKVCANDGVTDVYCEKHDYVDKSVFVCVPDSNELYLVKWQLSNIGDLSLFEPSVINNVDDLTDNIKRLSSCEYAWFGNNWSSHEVFNILHSCAELFGVQILKD